MFTDTAMFFSSWPQLNVLLHVETRKHLAHDITLGYVQLSRSADICHNCDFMDG